MQKALISSFLFLIVIATLVINIKSTKDDIQDFMQLDKTIDTIILVNKELDLFTKKSDNFINFDTIENKINMLKNNFKILLEHKVLNDALSKQLKQKVQKLQNDIDNKVAMIQDIKSINSLINNSYHFMPKIKRYMDSNRFNEIYATVLMSNFSDNFDIQTVLETLNKTEPKNKYETMFLNHAKIIISKLQEFKIIKEKIALLKIDKQLDDISYEYEVLTNSSIFKAQNSVIVLLVILILFVVFYIYYSSQIFLKNIQVERFKKTIENSDNIVVVTDKNEKIKYVNDAFIKSTGYTFEEVKGKKPSLLRSNKLSPEFYQKLHDTIHNGHKWFGEFINLNKNGETRYEKASITPVFDNKGNIIEFVALKLDITKEVLANAELEMKNEQLIQQSKMASMGEMLENIAHQWRQPLSVISTAATGLKMEKEFGVATKEKEFEILELINTTAQHLSQTIDDFRDFFKPDKLSDSFNIKDSYEKTFHIIESKFKNRYIEIIEDIQSITINSFENELIQALMNILNNARDALEVKENQKRLLFIHINKEDEKVLISIKDNAGGVPKKIKDKIFEPYFTTKHQAQGTGIGLYMTKEMIQKHLQGTIDVQNETYTYENIEYTGANFIITLPLNVK